MSHITWRTLDAHQQADDPQNNLHETTAGELICLLSSGCSLSASRCRDHRCRRQKPTGYASRRPPWRQRTGPRWADDLVEIDCYRVRQRPRGESKAAARLGQRLPGQPALLAGVLTSTHHVGGPREFPVVVIEVTDGQAGHTVTTSARRRHISDRTSCEAAPLGRGSRFRSRVISPDVATRS